MNILQNTLYCDDGPQVVVTGKKQVDMEGDGKLLAYGPSVNYVKKTLADRITITFNEPKPQKMLATILGHVAWAIVDRIEVMANGQTFAVGEKTVLGQKIVERREIKISWGEPS